MQPRPLHPSHWSHPVWLIERRGRDSNPHVLADASFQGLSELSGSVLQSPNVSVWRGSPDAALPAEFVRVPENPVTWVTDRVTAVVARHGSEEEGE